MCGLLSEAMRLRTKGLSPEGFTREAKRIRQKFEGMRGPKALTRRSAYAAKRPPAFH